ncbi:MAG TPA: glycosyltransferase family 4 protein [Candidatus Nanopelagicales bacterium]|nr:glycosyltransferase family 4 protein [Candidatus Nanopelagicales bacterium]
MGDPTPSPPSPPRRPSPARRAVRRAVGLLPAPRDVAALAVGRALKDLVTGRPPQSWRTPTGEPPLDPRRVEEARQALDEDRLADALAAAAEILVDHPRTVAAHEIRHVALLRSGELTASLAALRALRRIGDTPERADLDRRLVGMLRESDAGWLPRIPGPGDRIVPAAPGRILHLLKESPPDRQSGFAMRSHHILAAQRTAGLDPVAVTSLGFPRAAGRVAPAVETIDGIRVHRLDLGAGYPADVPLDRYLEDFAWLASGVVHAERPAILHAASGLRGYDMALVGLALRARHGLPLVYEVRSFLETSWSGREGAELAEMSRRRDAAETRAMTEADAVVTIAEAMREDVVARGVPPERVFVTPNGVDAEQFSPRPPDAALRARHGLHGFVFGYVSNLDHPREGQELLIEAAARLLSRGRDVTCLIVGDGRRRQELEERAAGARVGDRVVFTGSVPHAEVPAYYAALDAFVVPRRDERAARHVTPLKPFEAMAMERPLVVSDLPALREIAAPDERGLVFAPDDVDALVACLERLMDAPQLGHALGGAGRAWVVRERTWAANVPRYEAAYACALARRAAAR